MVPAPRFDPYHTWLGIPPSEQPPHLYRLLGLRLFEADPRVIENAADRQVLHLRSLCSGPNGADAQRLLNEVETARVSLLDPGRRAAYDEQLRREMAATSAAEYGAVGAMTAPQMISTPVVNAVSSEGQAATAFSPSRVSSKRITQRRPSAAALGAFSSLFMVFGGMTGLAIGVLIVYYLTGQDFLGLSNRLRAERQATPPNAPPTIAELPRDAIRNKPRAAQAEQKNIPAPPSTPDGGSSLAEKMPPQPSQRVASSPKPSSAAESAKAPLLAGVPTAWRMPPLISGEAAPLCQLGHEPTTGLELAIHTAVADIAPPAALDVRMEADNSQWTIRHLSDIEADGMGDPVATVRRDGLLILFAWAQPFADNRVRRELANCLLEIRHANDTRVVQLRQPVVMGPVALDLSDDRQEVECDVVDPPPSSTIRLKIRELVGFTRGAKLKGGVSEITLQRPAVIEFGDLQGAEIELRLARQPTTSKWIVRSEPIFREAGNKKFDLTLPSLEKMRVSQEKVLRESQADLSDVQTNLSRANAALRTLQSNRPQDINQLGNWNRQLVAVRGTIDQLSRREGRLNKQVAECRARLDAVPNLKSFLDSLHQKARIKYQICAGNAGKELLLVDGERAPGTSGAE